MDPFEWQCPHCSQHQVVTKETLYSYFSKLYVGKTNDGDVGTTTTAVRCVNPSCNKLTLAVTLSKAVYRHGDYESGEDIQNWRLVPESSMKVQPEYIPQPLREDYSEACLIRDKSPKASATLARRCLQGMIRDFCKISDRQLIKEINELRRRVEAGTAPQGVQPETVDAIDAIRGVGNIGAHMERDIDLIVEVDPGEAQALIELIEMLFEEWYVARHVRDQKLAKVKMIAAEKAAQIEAGRAALAQQKLAALTDQSEQSLSPGS